MVALTKGAFCPLAVGCIVTASLVPRPSYAFQGPNPNTAVMASKPNTANTPRENRRRLRQLPSAG